MCLTSDGVGSPAALHEHTSVTGSLVTASGGPFNHEARVDQYDSTAPVLTFVDENKFVKSTGYVKSQKVASWNPATDGMTYPIDLFDYFDPSKDWGALSSPGDWTHANAAGTGSDNNYVVGIRHLSAIASFDHSTLAKQWVLSSEIDSDFKFDAGVASSGYAEMYNMHDAKQLSSGNILAFDNGDARPEAEGGQYSRGVEYELDFTTMTAKLVWEFVTGEYSFHAGAANRMDNGNYIISHSCDGTIQASCNMLTFEADAAGNEVARIVTPKVGDSYGYRTEPWTTIFGERVLEEE